MLRWDPLAAPLAAVRGVLLPPCKRRSILRPRQLPQSVPPSPASWYTRVEYYHWNERIGGTDFVNESGALFTLGYSRQIGIERFCAELFGGDVHYDGYDQLATGLVSHGLEHRLSRPPR